MTHQISLDHLLSRRRIKFQDWFSGLCVENGWEKEEDFNNWLKANPQYLVSKEMIDEGMSFLRENIRKEKLALKKELDADDSGADESRSIDGGASKGDTFTARFESFVEKSKAILDGSDPAVASKVPVEPDSDAKKQEPVSVSGKKKRNKTVEEESDD